MWGANDPDNRQPMLWDDVAFQPERATPHQGNGARAARQVDRDLLEFYRKAIAFRKQHAALRRGGLRWVASGHDRLAGFWRTLGENRLLMLFNASDEALRYRLRSPMRDAWDGRRRFAEAVEVPARGWQILRPA